MSARRTQIYTMIRYLSSDAYQLIRLCEREMAGAHGNGAFEHDSAVFRNALRDMHAEIGRLLEAMHVDAKAQDPASGPRCVSACPHYAIGLVSPRRRAPTAAAVPLRVDSSQ